jgi:hypothetical protein
MGCAETREYNMPRHTEDRTFTIEVTVHARAYIETGGYSGGGGYTDEPPWTEIDEIEIDYIEVGPYDKVINIGATMRDILSKLAEEEFAE